MVIDQAYSGILEFVGLSAVFGGLTLVLRGASAFQATDRQRGNWRLNLSYYAFELLLLGPVLVTVATMFGKLFVPLTPSFMADFMTEGPAWTVAILAIALSDFAGYWRHRLMHAAVFWPVHAAHHSDEDLTWFSLVRFHPLNRIVAVLFDVLILTLAGVPLWAVVLNNRIRHYYGYLGHSDLGWRFGPLRYVFVSPFLHRWHHATDADARDKNFAVVFSFYDVLFGTFHCPEHRAEDLGVDDKAYPATFVGQMLYPFRVWFGKGPRLEAAAEEVG